MVRKGDWVKNILIWRLGDQKKGVTWKDVVDKDMNDLHIKTDQYLIFIITLKSVN